MYRHSRVAMHRTHILAALGSQCEPVMILVAAEAGTRRGTPRLVLTCGNRPGSAGALRWTNQRRFREGVSSIRSR